MAKTIVTADEIPTKTNFVLANLIRFEFKKLSNVDVLDSTIAVANKKRFFRLLFFKKIDNPQSTIPIDQLFFRTKFKILLSKSFNSKNKI